LRCEGALEEVIINSNWMLHVFLPARIP
jgi:hypothetical protein